MNYVRPAVRWPPGPLPAEREKNITIRRTAQGGFSLEFTHFLAPADDTGTPTALKHGASLPFRFRFARASHMQVKESHTEPQRHRAWEA